MLGFNTNFKIKEGYNGEYCSIYMFIFPVVLCFNFFQVENFRSLSTNIKSLDYDNFVSICWHKYEYGRSFISINRD